MLPSSYRPGSWNASSALQMWETPTGPKRQSIKPLIINIYTHKYVLYQYLRLFAGSAKICEESLSSDMDLPSYFF